MIHILYTHDHMARGQALAGAIPMATHGSIDTNIIMKPLKFKDLDTLTFWGHGDQYKFCGMRPPEMVKLIKKWKSYNSSLKYLELITCNARHCTSADPFANAVKSGLRAGFFEATHGIKVKALPVSVVGSSNAFSILLAEVKTKSWVYITAPGNDDKVLMDANHFVTTEPLADGQFKSYTGDLAVKANKVAMEHPVRNWTLNYGYFNNLRNNLVVI